MKTFDIISFHPGKQHNLDQAYQIHKSFASFRHLTGLYFSRNTVGLCEHISPVISSNLKKRTAELDGNTVDTNPLLELKMLTKRALGYKLNYDDYLNRNKLFQDWVLRKYKPPKVCIGFDNSSWIVFEQWKHKSFLVLDLTVAIPQYKLTLAREYGLDKEFVDKQTREDDKLYDIYLKELELADLVLCGSEFVKKSCLSIGINSEKLMVLPYGADLTKFKASLLNVEDEEVIKVVFIGTVGYRKGADILLKAWSRIVQEFDNVELHFYGNINMDLPGKMKGVYYHGFIAQENLIEELRTAHISVLPTFLEGSSCAIYQSMALGLSVITTPNAGSIIEHERNGLLIPYGNVNALYNSLVMLITDPVYRGKLVQNAVQDIKQYTWDEYGNKLSCLIKNKLEELNVLPLCPVP
jgi:glycosyltransferase involved in cell wall biosynthesis